MTILQALDRYYDRMERSEGGVIAPGWSSEKVAVVLELDENGTLLAADPWLNDKGKPREERVPKWFSRSGTGSTPFFLWDNAAYVLGLGAKDPGKTARDHAAFKALHARELAQEGDSGLAALRRFLEVWDAGSGPPPHLDDKLLVYGIAFRLRGEMRLMHQRPAAAAHVERLRSASEAGPEGFCLIRGTRLPLVRLHPKVKGIDGAASAEIPLVSFNNDAFTSYGKEQGFNAPTSELAAFRYGAALSRLLERGGANRLRIGDATVAFWADASAYDEAIARNAARVSQGLFTDAFGESPPPSKGANVALRADTLADNEVTAETVARDLEAVFQDAFNESPGPPTGTTDVQQARSVREALVKVAQARAEAGIRPDLLENVPFFVLGLAPNVARVAVRYWLSGSFARFADALDAHAAALAIEPPPRGWGRKQAPSPSRLLLKTTALQEKFDNIPNGLAAEVTRAILDGRPYPRTWLAAILIRLRAGDDPESGWHAAAIKACVNRALDQIIEALRRNRADIRTVAKLEKEKLPVALDPDREDTPYQLGRLFYLLVSAQREALGRGLNATIADRYYGAASATPARVFGPLLRGLRTHVSDANKRNRGWWIDEAVAKVMAKLPPELPRSLKLEEQGRFAVGFYHERGHRDQRMMSDTHNLDDQETP